MGKLDGKVAVITGGSDGIGLATAQLFSQEGATVVITGRDQSRLDSAGLHSGGKIDRVRSDISVMADIEHLCTHVKTHYGHVDILFANAGGGRPGLFTQITEEDFDFTVTTNFKGTFFTVQKLIPLMNRGSSVILTTSTLNQQGQPYVSVYSATKATIRSLARSLAAELSDSGIRINALSPGLIDTDQARKVGMSEEMIEQSNAHLHTLIPMHRSGTADEIARGALFLASGDSSYITGSELCVDGGWAQV